MHLGLLLSIIFKRPDIKARADVFIFSYISRMASLSADTFRSFYDRHFIPLYYFARGYVHSDQSAEDIVTEAFIRLWNKHEDFDNPEKIKNFLYIAARNLAVDHLRREKRRLARDGAFTQLISEPSEHALLKEELTGSLFQCIYEEADKLPDQLKQVFHLAYTKGLSNDEIARAMNLSDQTVRNYKAAALKALRKALQGKDLLTLLVFLTIRSGIID